MIKKNKINNEKIVDLISIEKSFDKVKAVKKTNTKKEKK